VPISLLARAVEPAGRDLASSLLRLAEAGFLCESGSGPPVEYAFRHPLIEAVAFDSQLRQKRARIHAAIAHAIVDLDPDGLDEQAARLAYHFENADEPLAAVRWHRRAAEWIGLAEPSEALRHWRRVRQLARRLDDSAGAEALALACHQTLNLGWRLGLSDEEMRAAVAQCRETAGRIDPALIVRVLCAYALCQNSRGAIRENVEPLTEALRIARAERSPDMEIDVLLTLGDSMALLGRLREAERFCTRVIALTRGDAAHVNFGGTRSCIKSLASRGSIRAELGRHREAQEDLEQALRLSDEQARSENLLFSLRLALELADLSGVTQLSLARARRLAQLAQESGSPLFELDASLCAGIAHSSHERFEEAIGLLEQAVERIDERGFAKPERGRALTALSRAYLGAGRLPEAVETAARAVRACQAAGTRSRECMARIALARAQLARDGVAARRKVREGLSKVEALVEETGARGYRPFMCEIRALLARAGDDAVTARGELRRAQRLFTRMGASGHAERVERELAALQSSGPGARARRGP
jgi:adenylate cyclase